MFKTITGSASKLVFLALTVTACLVYAYSVYAGKTTIETKDFMSLALLAYGFYFANKGEAGAPYAGK